MIVSVLFFCQLEPLRFIFFRFGLDLSMDMCGDRVCAQSCRL